MAKEQKESLFDKLIKAIKGEDLEDNKTEKNQNPQIEVTIDGKKHVVPHFVAINLQQNKK